MRTQLRDMSQQMRKLEETQYPLEYNGLFAKINWGKIPRVQELSFKFCSLLSIPRLIK